METSDRQYLLRSLELAEERRGFCSPNPAVGAVVVVEGRIVAEGNHQAAGQPHAEVVALDRAGGAARGATLYVSLEPCCHWGRTPPCTDAVLRAGVARVVYGFADPNPQVNGKGATRLREAGVNCDFHELEEIRAFYRSYSHWRKTGRPFVTAKLALSLDGKIAGPGGTPVTLTGESAARLTHASRYRTDAILTSQRTILRDNPRLDSRRAGMPVTAKPLYVLDPRAELPLESRIFSTAASVTVFHLQGMAPEGIRGLSDRGASCIGVPPAKDAESEASGPLDLAYVLERIGADGKHDLWVEGGGTLFEGLGKANLIGRALIYLAPKWLGPEGHSAFSKGMVSILEHAKPLSAGLLGRDTFLEWEW